MAGAQRQKEANTDDWGEPGLRRGAGREHNTPV